MKIYITIIILLLFSNSCTEKVDCEKFHKGKFYMYSSIVKQRIIIERNDTMQTETVDSSGLCMKSKVMWVSPCEYTLQQVSYNKPQKDAVDSFLSAEPIEIEIVGTGDDYYVFKSIVDSADKHLEYVDTIKVFKQGL